MPTSDTSLRESEASRQISMRSNGLVVLGPMACCFSILSFFLWCAVWLNTAKAVSPQSFQEPQFCNDIVSKGWLQCFQDSAYQETFAYVHFLGAFGFFIVGVVHSYHIHFMMIDPSLLFCILPPQWVSICCSYVVLTIGFLVHLLMGFEVFPAFLSARGRVFNVPMVGQWFALIPVLVTMMHAFDVRDKDVKKILISGAFLTSSVGADFMASMSHSNPRRANTCGIFSFFTFTYIFVTLNRCQSRYKTVKEYIDETADETRLVGFLSDMGLKCPIIGMKDHCFTRNQRMFNNDTPLVERDFIVKEVVACINNQSIIMSYNLALFCTITWTIIATIHIAGALRLLSHLMEDIFLTITDLVAKGFFSIIVCANFAAQQKDVHNRITQLEAGILRGRSKHERKNTALYAYESSQPPIPEPEAEAAAAAIVNSSGSNENTDEDESTDFSQPQTLSHWIDEEEERRKKAMEDSEISSQELSHDPYSPF